jgi:hypothetical protein
MIRLMVLVALFAVGYVAYHQTRQEREPAAAVDTSRVPEQFRSLLADRPDVVAIMRSHGLLPAADAPGSSSRMRPFADVGRPAQIRAVRRDIRRDVTALNRLSRDRALAEAYASAARPAAEPSRTQHIKVLDFDGVFVSGDRALAQVVYRRATKAPSGRFVAHAPATTTVTLARERGRWRLLRGFQ